MNGVLLLVVRTHSLLLSGFLLLREYQSFRGETLLNPGNGAQPGQVAAQFSRGRSPSRSCLRASVVASLTVVS